MHLISAGPAFEARVRLRFGSVPAMHPRGPHVAIDTHSVQADKAVLETGRIARLRAYRYTKRDRLVLIKARLGMRRELGLTPTSKIRSPRPVEYFMV